MADIALLRSKAMGRISAALHREEICLDDDKGDRIIQLQNKIERLKNRRVTTLEEIADAKRRGEDVVDQRMAGHNPVTVLDDEIREAERELEEAHKDAAEDTIVLVFSRATPDEYNKLADSNRNAENELDIQKFAKAIMTATFKRVETVDGETIEDLPWSVIETNVLSHGDFESIGTNVIVHCRKVGAVPFSKPTSGNKKAASK